MNSNYRNQLSLLADSDDSQIQNLYAGYTLHQIGPYIGKLRPSLARYLIKQYTKESDWIWDPFCGSGTIPLESSFLRRNVIASDINPYACILTKAKLHAPESKDTCLLQLTDASKDLNALSKKISDDIPQWVKKFFHPRTLNEVIALMGEFNREKQYFHMACLLSILHHQRPGFLSYPACNLVPYLRDKLFPRHKYPELYKYRDPLPRLAEKIERIYKSPPPPATIKFEVLQESVLNKYLPDESINAVITSPPYMDALDYARDNRLRLWFLGIDDYSLIKKSEIRKISTFKTEMLQSLTIMSQVIKPGGVCIFILGDVKSSSLKYNLPKIITEIIEENILILHIEDKWQEEIPDKRRSRRRGRATNNETVLVFRRQ